MRTLIYKRTHSGDPDATGRFGINHCMGSVRRWNFDAVVGIGGVSRQPVEQGLARRVNWIGIGPHKWKVPGNPHLVVTFDHFWFRGSGGPYLRTLAPKLADRIYAKNVRVLMDGISPAERKEVDKILALANRAPPSRGGRTFTKSARGC